MFKTRGKFFCSVKLLAVIIIASLGGSCSTAPMKAYSGPERPASETVLIKGTDTSINIVGCDGVQVNSTTVIVLPGKHTLEASYSEIKSEGYYSEGTMVLMFTAEAGHSYLVDKVIHTSSPGMSRMFVIDGASGKEVSTGMIKPGTETTRLAMIENKIKEYPKHAEFWAEKGYLLIKLKRYEEALTSLERATALKPDFVEAWFYKTGALYELKKYDEAITAVDKLIQLRPNEPAFKQIKQDILKRANSRV